jgi:plastocyanin
MRTAHLALAIVSAALITPAGCGGGSDGGSNGGSGGPTGPSGSQPANAVTISITGENALQSFSPNPASVGGQTVVFQNTDNQVHRVVLNDGSIDTGDIPAGGTSRSFVMPTSGTNYHCSIHPGMIGAVNPAAGGPPPPCQGPYCDGY